MNPADHEWAKEAIAAHLAGCLSADERTRLEAHTAACAECIAEIDAVRRFDRQMDELFLPIRPKAGLEERVIQRLRVAPVQKPRSMVSHLGIAAAAVILLGVVGYGVMNTTEYSARQEPFRVLEGIGRPMADAPALKMPPSIPLPPPEFWKDPNGGIGGAPQNGIEATPGRLASAEELAKQRIEGGEVSVARFADELGSETGKRSGDHGGAGRTNGATGGYRGRSAAEPQAPGIHVPSSVPQPPDSPASAPPPRPAPVALAFAPDPAMDRGRALPEAQKKEFTSLRDDGPAKNKQSAAPAPAFFKPGDAPPKEVPKTNAGPAGSGLALAAKVDGAPSDEKIRKALRQNESRDLKFGGQGQEQDKTGQEPAPPQAVQRKVIRTGDVDYEIESFDSSLATISRLVEEEGGFIGTVNSDKLANGKVRGTVVLRCAPERLDTLLLKLRGLGELKAQNIRSQDVSRQYYDLEGRLKAARTMEERLLRIIKEGKGEIKDLLLAEKELGEWRTKIEAFEGEKRYYDSQIALSTLTVTLTEKEIRAPFAVTETERVRMGVEVEDVEKAHRAALVAVAEAKGRVTRSELKQLAAGQFSALVYVEVSPDAAGPLRDRFKQLGNVARLDIDRVQETEGGSGKIAEFLKVRQKDTQVSLDLYNLANIQARETVHLSLACLDAEASYKLILARIEKAGGRVITSSLNRQKNDQTAGMVTFEIKAAEAEAVLLDVRLAGEVMRLDVTENPDTQNVTKSKRGFECQIFAMGLVEPRETTTLQIASKDVPEAYRRIQEAVQKAEGRITVSQLNETDRQNVSATLQFDLRRDQDAALAAVLAQAGEVMTRTSTRAQEVERVVDSKKRLLLTLVNYSSIPARETYTVAVEVENVDTAVTGLEALAAEAKGRIADSRHTRDGSGRSVSKIVVDLPLVAARALADKVKGLGMVRIFDGTRNPQAPEGDLAVARIDVTLSNLPQLVDAESGPWTRIKSGLSVSLTALSWSLTLVVVGLCFALPVGLFVWGGAKLYRRMKPKAA